MDRLLSMHVMALHAGRGDSGAKRMAEGDAAGGSQGGCGASQFAGVDGYDKWSKAEDAGLGLRLREAAARLGDAELLTHSLLRKYIAYARAHVHPVLSDAARDVIDEFYMQLRNKQRGGDSVPVTARQLESLIRLAEARARMDLREEVTKADALDAVAVVRETIIYDTLADLVGGAQLAGGTGGAPAPGAPRGPAFAPAAGKRPSHRKVATDFKNFLDHEVTTRGDCWYTTNELMEAFNRSGQLQSKNSFAEFVEAINHEGLITYRYRDGKRMYRPVGGNAEAMSMHGSQR